MKKEDIKKLEDLGCVADSFAYRENLIELLNNDLNNKNLKEIQEELKKVQKSAKKKGLFTRSELLKKEWTFEYALEYYNENQKKILFKELNKNLLPKKKIKPKKI